MWSPETETPAWRYTTASAELEREMRGRTVYHPHPDPALRHLKEFLRTLIHCNIDREHIRHVFGPLMSTHMWYHDKRHSGMKDTLEAMLLARCDFNMIKAYVTPTLDYQSMRMYCLFYFDVEKYMDTPMWIERNVFAPASQVKDARKVSAYLWKVIAYHGGPERLAQAAVAGKSMETATVSWLRNFCISTKIREIVNAAANLNTLGMEEKIPMITIAENQWDRQEERQEGGEAVGDKADIAASDGLHKALKTEKKDSKVCKEETSDDVEKFDDQEFVQ